MHGFERLFQPITIKGITIRNRIAMSAMNNNFANSDGSASPRLIRYYEERGKGGTGLIMISGAYVDAKVKKRGGGLLIDDDRLVPSLKNLAETIQKAGAKVLQQINHNGRLMSSSKLLKTAASLPGRGVSPRARTDGRQIHHRVPIQRQGICPDRNPSRRRDCAVPTA